MSFDASVTIEGIQEAQAENLRAAEAVMPRGALGAAIKAVTLAIHRADAGFIHVDTGSAKSSRIVRLNLRELRGEVTSDPAAVNPRSGQRPAHYLQFEFARGGTHDAPARVMEQEGKWVAMATRIIERGIS